MTSKLENVLERYEKLNNLVSTQEVLADMDLYRKYTKEIADMEETVSKYKEYKKLQEEKELAEQSIASETDSEMKSLLQEEVKELKSRLEEPHLRRCSVLCHLVYIPSFRKLA